MSPVFMAQVAKPMSLLRDQGWDVSLLVLSPIGEILRPALNSAWRKRCEEIRKASPMKVVRLPSPPSRAQGLWSEAPVLRFWLRKQLGIHGNAIVHCRGYEAAKLALIARQPLSGIRIIYDCRGLNGVERAYMRGYLEPSRAPWPILNKMEQIEKSERMAARNADALFCVSAAMKHAVCQRWGIADEKISVVPCSTDTYLGFDLDGVRESVRRKLKLEGRFVVAYCGSLAPWQAVEDSLEWFKHVARSKPNAYLLAVTTHPERMTRYANQARIPESARSVLSVSQSKVIEYLAAADCGLLVRKPSLVNQVASPVKFAEYLSAGVPVMISENVGDYSECVKRHGLGTVLPNCFEQVRIQQALDTIFSLVDAARRDETRLRCRAFARENLDWSANVQTIGRTYEALLPQARRTLPARSK